MLCDMFVQNNPKFISGISAIAPELKPRQFLISFGLIISIANGIILSAITTGVEKFKTN
jgi:hypothetical protein